MKYFRLMLICLVLTGINASAQTFMRKAGVAGPATIKQQITEQKSEKKLSGIFEEGFEAYDDFVQNFPLWTTVDLDGRPTWGIESVTFPNHYTPMSYIIFNPSATNPPMANQAIQPHEGSKFAACFSANALSNNDWLISPPLQAGSNTSVSFYVKSYTSQYGLERFRVGISTTDNQPSDFTFITGPNYLTAPAEAWELITFDLSAYDGQTLYIAINCISEQAFIFMVDDFRFTTTLPESSTVTGMVTDATNGAPIEGAEVCISGICTFTDAQGNYLIDQIPRGSLEAEFSAYPAFGSVPLEVMFNDQSTDNTHTVSCTKIGYLTYSNSQVSVPQGGSLTLNLSLSPVLQEGNMRFVLNWGPLPTDLDSHMLTPEIEGNTYHIYYDDEGSILSAPYAQLDFDITTGFGPETMTIYQMKSGTYSYYVHNFSGNPALSASRAVVQIYGEEGLLETVPVPGSGTGNYWHVCNVNGETSEIQLINVILEEAPFEPSKSKDHESTYSVFEAGYINNWLWDFGDGNISTLRNPVHTYNQTGNYTVSLTVGNGISQSTRVKPSFVHVGTQSDQLQDEDIPFVIYPIPARDVIKVTGLSTLLKVDIFSMTGSRVFESESNDNDLTIDISTFKSSVYLMQIHTTKGSYIRKFNKI